MVNSVYTTQPTLTVVNGLTQSNGSGYLVTNSKFDLLYMWTPRFSTDTNYSANGAWYQASTQKGSNYIDQTVGQTLRYAFSPVVTGVIDGRYSHISYKGVPGSTFSNDSDTIYALVGTDVTLTRRLSASGRVGETTRDYVQAGLASTSSPYAETSLNYLLSRTSIVALDARYGYENGGTGGQSSKSVRTGINYTQSFTSKLRGTAGMNYTHVGASSEGSVVSQKQDALGLSLGAQYAVSKALNVFANINRVQNFASNDAASYYKDVFYLGATLQY